MSQNYPSNDQKVKLDNENQWNALETLRSGFSGTTPPLSPTPVEGQRYYNTGDKKWYVYVANGDGTYSWMDESFIGAIAAEVMAARGTLSSLNTRLSVLLGENGMPVLPVTQNVSEWADPQITATYVSGTEFTCESGKSVLFPASIPLLITVGGVSSITEVVSAEEVAANAEEALSAYTKVTIHDALLSETEAATVKVAFAFTSLPKSDATPQQAADAGSAGTSAQYARGDHVHPRGPEVKVYVDGESDSTIIAATVVGDLVIRMVSVDE